MRVKTPRYVQIADELAEEIRAERLAPGEPVPSEAVLMERYGVATGTVRNAMRELRDRGLVETRHGAGSFVKRRSTLIEGSVPIPFDVLARLKRRHGLAPDGLRHAIERAEITVELSDDGWVLTYRVPLD